MSRTNPFEELERLFERMSEQVEPGEWQRWGVRDISVDLIDRGDGFELHADLPGYDRSDIDLTLSEGRLRIEAVREIDVIDEDSEDRYVLRERAKDSVSRSVRLPEPIDDSEAVARYRNGVLTITLPKEEPAGEGTRIDIE